MKPLRNLSYLIILFLLTGDMKSQTCASFIFNPSFYTASFTNTSTCTNVDYYIWYNENDTLISQNAVFIFPGCGKYNICLAAYDSFGNVIDSICDTIYLPPVGMPCHAGFIVSQAKDSLNNLVPGHLLVKNRSCGLNLKYTWRFGDGDSSTKKNPVTHIYSSNGPYSLCQKISDGTCDDIYCYSIELDSGGMLKSAPTGFILHFEKFNQALVSVRKFQKESWKMYPNPTNQKLTIELPGGFDGFNIELLDNKGRVLNQIHNLKSTHFTFDIDGPPGLYFLRIQNENEIWVEKVMKI